MTTSALLTVVPFEESPPAALFSYSSDDLTLEFSDLSSPIGCASEIVQWAWDSRRHHI